MLPHYQTYRDSGLLSPEYAASDDPYILRFERMPVRIFRDAGEGSREAAAIIAAAIRDRASRGEHCVLGLATGSTPVTLYGELVRLHREEGLSFRNVVTFNLDEYYPMHPGSLQSYHRFMQEYLFGHIDILAENIHIPDGMVPQEDLAPWCREYEQRIREAGGIDIQVLGIGRTGHIGFNEPGSAMNSPTRVITLDHVTRTDAASDFYGEEHVPKRAVTMGIGTILSARKVILMAWGEAKAAIVQRTVEGPVTDQVPATFLQQHPDAVIMLDQVAAAALTRIQTPWLAGPCRWNDRLVRKGVVWLCQRVDKPILRLTDRDYNDNGMGDLLTEYGPSSKINIGVFNDLQHTISGWPGGKPNADDTTRPERALPYPKRVLVFSPHPDDDVISMGGTLVRLVDQGHEVHTAYMTSGSIAVFDDDVVRYSGFVSEYLETFGIQDGKTGAINREITLALSGKQPGQADTQEIRRLKAAIRRGEARSACRYAGIAPAHVHFLDLPFYETGEVRKRPVGEEDIRIVTEMIASLQPHQVYAAGDFSDPHGTHRVCMNAIAEALYRLRGEPWMNDCRVWLYRGAWQEWEIEKVDMAVPLSPEEVDIKRQAIFRHQSQKDRPLFPGTDNREFWQRAEDRNHGTAQLYDRLGMAEYQAIEVFVRYEPADINR